MVNSHSQKLDEIDYFYQKCLKIDKQLGGNIFTKQQNIVSNQNDLDLMEHTCRETIFEFKKKIQDRDQRVKTNGRNNPSVIRVTVELKDKLQESKRQIARFGEMIKKKKKQSGKQYEMVYEEVKRELEQLEAVERGDVVDDIVEHQSIGDLKNRSVSRKVRDPFQRVDANDIELETINRYKQNDSIIDQKVQLIAQQAVEWKQQAIEIGEKQDVVGIKVHKVNAEVDKANQIVGSQNTRLKKLLRKYRPPSKFFLDVVLFLTFFGLIAVLLNMMK